MTEPRTPSEDRREQIVKNLRLVIETVRAGKSLTDGYGMQITPLHDIASDLDALVLFSNRWEEHARAAGLNPRTGKPLIEAAAGVHLGDEGLRKALMDMTGAYHLERKHAGKWDVCQSPRCQNARLALEGRGPFAGLAK